jgi:alanine dehydrogenase
MKLADRGVVGAIESDRAVRAGVNTCNGRLTCEAIGISQQRPWSPVEHVLKRTGQSLVANHKRPTKDLT